LFTGLIQDVGIIERLDTGAMTEVWVVSHFAPPDFKLGESIAADGCCLTVTQAQGPRFRVQASLETLSVTTLGSWQAGRKVNLERALKVGDRMGGHWVQGHVDGLSELVSRRPQGGSEVMVFRLPAAMARFFIEKGSVTIDGVSLTVNRLHADTFEVAIIPETLARTTLGEKAVGAAVNIEADVLGKYVARQLGSSGSAPVPTLTEEMLRKAGF
jgi:riboflavin synthase